MWLGDPDGGLFGTSVEDPSDGRSVGSVSVGRLVVIDGLFANVAAEEEDTGTAVPSLGFGRSSIGEDVVVSARVSSILGSSVGS